MKSIDEEVRELWNSVAQDWQLQVGDDGDSNRLLNSDPILWRFVGDVHGLPILKSQELQMNAFIWRKMRASDGMP